MVYALCDLSLAYGDAVGVLEFESEVAAEEDFRATIIRKRGRENFAERYLFRSRQAAEQANLSTDEEVEIDETLSYRTLTWERGVGFNF